MTKIPSERTSHTIPYTTDRYESAPRHRHELPFSVRRLLLVAAGVACVSAAVSLVLQPSFTARTAFVIEAGEGEKLSGLAMLASEFGVGQGGDAARSPRFYVTALRSDAVMAPVLATPFRPTPSDSPIPLHAVLNKKSNTRRGYEKARAELEGMTGIDLDPQTSVVTVRVTAQDRHLAAAVADRYVAVLDIFNREQRQSRSKRRREFLQGRVTASRQELVAAEEASRQFLMRNRDPQASPSLALEMQRLARDVQAKQEVYTTVLKQYETSRIDEVNDQPTISFLSRAEVPAEPSPLRPVKIGLVTLVLLVFPGLAYLLSERLFGIHSQLMHLVRWVRLRL